MKAPSLLLLLLTCCFVQVFAQNAQHKQNSLVGTWKETTDTLEEIKIISPTHVFFAVRDIKGDSIAYAGAGTYTAHGNTYTENLQYATFELNDSGYSFTYQLDGDKFYQQGVMMMRDGSQIPISHTFVRVKPAKAYNGPHVGTWNQLSSSFQSADGHKGSHTNATHIRYQIISPTHWMRISMVNGQFENAFGGTYTLQGNKMTGLLEYGTGSGMKGARAEITQRVQGSRLYWSGKAFDQSGKPMSQFEDVFERVSGAAQKSTAAAKKK